jgi:proline racemase
MALLHARNPEIIRQTVTIDSLTGESFNGRISEVVTHHNRTAVIPEVGGTASFTGKHTFLVEPSDALGGGFLVR